MVYYCLDRQIDGGSSPCVSGFPGPLNPSLIVPTSRLALLPPTFQIGAPTIRAWKACVRWLPFRCAYRYSYLRRPPQPRTWIADLFALTNDGSGGGSWDWNHSKTPATGLQPAPTNLVNNPMNREHPVSLVSMHVRTVPALRVA